VPGEGDAVSILAGMAELKPAYLIHGDDDVKLDAWRARVRDRAAREEASFELMNGAQHSGEDVALALSSMTLSMGGRYILVDCIERWKDKDVGPVVEALASPPPETVVVMLGTVNKESGSRKWSPSAKLVKAVQKAGGEVTEASSPKLAGLPGWVVERGRDLGLSVDRDAARALVDQIGTRQRRLLRELEKIKTYDPEGGKIDLAVVEAMTAHDVEAQAYQLADAVIDGDRARALALADDLQTRGVEIMHILYAMLRRTRDMRRAWAVIEAGGTTNDVQAVVGGPGWMAKRLASAARQADGERLERIAAGLADLDFAIRGGGNVDTDTALTLTLAAA
jgi:DNA polymerase III subunit delta